MMAILRACRSYRRALRWHILCPVLLSLLLTPWSADWDQNISSYFYKWGHFVSDPWLTFLYHYGLLPAWIVAIVAALLIPVSYYWPMIKKWRTAALFLLTLFATGPGLIVHVLLKDHWGRPRPRQVIEYGGQQPFRPYYMPNFFQQPEPSKSFPCGHCSMGFYFFALAMLGKRYRRRLLYYGGNALAWGLGGTLSFIRIAQGGHFFSDTLFSALIMWLMTVGLYPLFFNDEW